MTHSHTLNKNYIAGLFDGEGFVNLKNYNGKTHIRWLVSISNQHKGVLEAIQTEYGGKLRLKTNKIECWELKFETKPDVLKFLTEIEPYLIIKKERAIECLKLINK